MAQIRFTKTSASGNDFIIVDNRSRAVPGDEAAFARSVCRRRLSVGADGVLLLETSGKPGAHFRMRVINADGSEAEMCGNGARTVARFAQREGIAPAEMCFETIAGIISAEVMGEEVRLAMGDPTGLELAFPLTVDSATLEAHFVNTGVPHTVVFVPDLEAVDVVGLGRAIRRHERFQPAGTNADFVCQGPQPGELALRTYERGVEDETLACGTGAVAAAIIAQQAGKVEPPVKVKTRGGTALTVTFRAHGTGVSEVALEGDARLIYDGVLTWET